jgi:hypothetical protein
MLQHFQRNLIRSLIKRKQNKQTKPARRVSLKEAKNIGILTMIETEEAFDQILDFSKDFEVNGAVVKGLAFVPSKTIPDFLLSQSRFKFFSKRDVNIVGIPRSNEVLEFLETGFDILLDLSLAEYLPLSYVVGVSNAGMKAGRYSNGIINDYDFMILENGGSNFGDFLDSMKNYLSKINNT